MTSGDDSGNGRNREHGAGPESGARQDGDARRGSEARHDSDARQDEEERRGSGARHDSDARPDEEERRGSGARPGSDQPNKVIRLPRDWLGPREELTPFGPSAEDSDVTSRRSGASSTPLSGDGAAGAPGDEAPGTAPDAGDEDMTAEDFWGERSAAIQGPLDESERGRAKDGLDDRDPDRLGLRRRLRVPAAAAVAAVRRPIRMPAVAAVAAVRRPIRMPAVAAVAAVLALATAIVGVFLLGQSSERSGLRAQVGTGLDRGIPSVLPSLPSSVAGQHGQARSGAASRHQPHRASHANRAVPVNYVHSASPQTGGASSASSPSTRAPRTSSPRTPSSPKGPKPSPYPRPTNNRTHHSAKTCVFGPNCALGPGHSPEG